jgi:hypothetical protein
MYIKISLFQCFVYFCGLQVKTRHVGQYGNFPAYLLDKGLSLFSKKEIGDMQQKNLNIIISYL